MHSARIGTSCAALLSLSLAGCAGSPPQPATVPVCRGDQLVLRAGPADAGMGHVTQTLVLQRRGRGTCQLSGTPHVRLLDARGASLPTVQRARTFTVVPRRLAPAIRLAPGDAAHFTVHYATATGYSGPGEPRCPASAAIAVIPPGTRTSLHLPLTIAAYGGLASAPVCGELWVSALRPGAD